MTNAVLPKTKQAMLDAILALGTLEAQLVDTALYTYSAAHQFLSDIPAGARVGSAVALTGVTTTDGVLDANDPTFTLSAPPSIEGLALVVNTGNPATSPILAWIDAATGLPVAAGSTGGTVAWSNGVNKIFKL